MWIMTAQGWRLLATPNCIQPAHVPSLLEQMGLGKRTANAADLYCAAIDRYLLPREHLDHIDEQTCMSILGAHGSR